MNRPSEWKKIYHPRMGRYVVKHKGTGVIRDTLMNIGKPLFKSAASAVKSAAKALGKKTVEKAADAGSKVIVKKAGDKIGNLLRKKSIQPPPARRKPLPARSQSKVSEDAWIRLNQLISQE